MSAVEQSITGFKKRMAFTYDAAISPFKFLYGLLSVKGGNGYEFALSIAIFGFGILSSPVLLTAGVVTSTVGILAAAVQAVVFPFQLFFAGIKDFFSSVSKKIDNSLKEANEPRIIGQDNPLYAQLLKNVNGVKDGYEEVVDEASYVTLFPQKDEAALEEQAESSYSHSI